jgi:hypothetical protein
LLFDLGEERGSLFSGWGDRLRPHSEAETEHSRFSFSKNRGARVLCSTIFTLEICLGLSTNVSFSPEHLICFLEKL